MTKEKMSWIVGTCDFCKAWKIFANEEELKTLGWKVKGKLTICLNCRLKRLEEKTRK